MEKDIKMPHYIAPQVEKTAELKKEGFDAEFQMTESGLRDLKSGKIYQPEELHIVDFFRFEGITNPDDMAILYAIKADDGLKGTILDAYGLYSDDDLGAFMKKVDQSAVNKKA